MKKRCVCGSFSIKLSGKHYTCTDCGYESKTDSKKRKVAEINQSPETFKLRGYGFLSKKQLNQMIETIEGEDLVELFYAIKNEQHDLKEDSDYWKHLESSANRITEKVKVAK